MVTAAPLEPAPAIEEVDPAAATDRLRRQREFNVRVVPRLRALGFLLLSLVVVVHNAIVRPPFAGPAFLRFAVAVAGYSALSALALRRFYGHTGPIDLGRVFLVTDIAFFLFAIHTTGGEKSWLLFL